MLKTLIAVEPDLPSRIAIRFACQLRNETDINMHLVHVFSPDDGGTPIGTGWVQKTWENSVLQSSKNRVNRMVKNEKQTCPVLNNPQFVEGDLEQYLMQELTFSGYNLLIEGVFHSFLPNAFLKKIRSSLYKRMPCPILLVKNLVDPDKGILILDDGQRFEKAIQTFFNIFPKSSIIPEFLVYGFGGSASSDMLTSSQIVEKIDEHFSRLGKSHKGIRVVQGDVDTILPHVRDYAVVVSELPMEGSPMEELLSKSPCPILFYV